MNKIRKLFTEKKYNILSVYFTAGFPALHDTIPVIKHLQEAGADLVEIGIPFSDPVADGPTIQYSSKMALDNGMNLKLLVKEIAEAGSDITIPVLMMGYINPILQYGVKRFCEDCARIGVSGLIIPDLPMDEFLKDYKSVFEENGLINIYLITPQTSDERIRYIDKHSEGFIYMVSSASTTGARQSVSDKQIKYFERIKRLNLQNPRLIGFGISDRNTFEIACRYAQGAIIGSAFINLLKDSIDLENDIKNYIHSVREK